MPLAQHHIAMPQRRNLLKAAAALGLLQAAPPWAQSAVRKHKVIVVGAGAAGMVTAHRLLQQGVDVVVCEASREAGGRMKTDTGFADFPLSLGAEWLHAPIEELSGIALGADRGALPTMCAYGADANYGEYADGQLRLKPLQDEDDLIFVGDSWLGFFQQQLLPGIAPRIRYNTAITHIDYSGPGVRLRDQYGGYHSADAVIVTVPIHAIRSKSPSFHPALPAAQQRAFDEAPVWTGLKAFFRFKRSFYPTFLELQGDYSKHGQRLYYDAAYGQSSDHNILGLFAVGRPAQPWLGLPADELCERALAELDDIFAGQASREFLACRVQDWSQQRFIHQAYLSDHAHWKYPPRMRQPLHSKVFFAGEAYTDGEDWGSVHCAAQSAVEAVEKVLADLA